MSATDKPGDPADKAADGAFGGVQNHRAGYADDKLQHLIDWLRAHPTTTLASGEGALLLAEIDRLRARCREIDDEAYDYAEQIELLKAAAKDSADHYADARAEINHLRAELVKARAAIERVRALHEPIAKDIPKCVTCKDYASYHVYLPCPTLRALDGDA